MHLFVENLTNVDFSYLHPERGLVGETWLASVILEGALDKQGMVCDFGIVKKTLRNWLDDTIDHSLVVAAQSPNINLQLTGNNICLDWQYGNKGASNLVCSSPVKAITLINSSEITPESVATWCIEQLRALLPDSIDKIQLHFEPEAINHHFYHYSHGLKKHAGNCQRIAHGHRSTIEIYKNEQRHGELEKSWCELWRDIYIGTQEDLKEEFSIEGKPYYLFSYESQQGHFELTIPAENCYLIDTDSTVEFIAQHIAQQLNDEHPNDSFKIKAFEGIGKGAIAFS